MENAVTLRDGSEEDEDPPDPRLEREALCWLSGVRLDSTADPEGATYVDPYKIDQALGLAK